MKIIVIITLFLLGYNSVSLSQNLDSYPQAKRDSILVSIAKEVILKYGPGYYREFSNPEIKRLKFPPKGERNSTGENANRIYYIVTFRYDKTKELLEFDFAAFVRFWADTGIPDAVSFGNGIGVNIPESHAKKFISKKQKNKEDTIPKNDNQIEEYIEPIPYQQAYR